MEDKQEICNILNNYYVNIMKSLLKDQTPTTKNKIHTLSTNLPNSMYLEKTSVDEILTIVKSMNGKKSVSDDNLSTFFIKHVISEIITPLNHIFNLSLSQGIFPTCFKTSKIIPIFKKGSREEISNYRPISLLSPLSKILEKIMAIRLKSFLQKNNLLTDKQYGFRPHHSTELALLEFAQNILNNMNKKILTVGLFIDLAKAFDLIDHDLLIHKLDSYGVRGAANSWIKSYLNDRFQYVSLENFNSDKIKISSGVPQGSILGPLLFVIFINDLCKSFSSTNFILFADDTNIFFPTINPSLDEFAINNKLIEIVTWFSSNKLIINHSKCVYMIFGAKILTNQIQNINLKINNIIIPRVTTTKFLGVIIRDNLSWDLHIESVSTKLNKTLGMLYKIRHKLNQEILNNLYYSLIYPHFIYCNLLWGNSPNDHLKLLKKCQNRFIRLFYNLPPRTTISQYFSELKLLNVTQINILSIAIFVFKFLRNRLPNYFNNFYKYSTSLQLKTTRHTPIFYTQIVRIKLISTSIKHTGPRIWTTMIPDDIKNSNSLHLFKNKLKKYLIQKNTIFDNN